MFGEYSQAVKVSLTTALVISACIVDSVAMSYDGTVMGSINVMPSYKSYFSINTATKAVNTTSTSLGAILTALLAGSLSDKRGRLEVLAYSAVLNIVGAAIAAAAQNLAMFIAGRMIIGLGLGLGQSVAGVYVSETTAPKVRAFALGMYYTCWSVGSMVATGISYGCTNLEPSTWAWRVPTLLQALAPVLLLLVLPILPESPRWLIAQDRFDDGLKVLVRVNGASSSEDPSVQVQYREIVDTIAYEKAEGKSIAFAEMIRNAPNRRRIALALSVAVLTMLNGTNIITYYYGDMLSQAGITSSKTQMEINLILSAWHFVVAVAGSILADRLGRRFLMLSASAGCTLMMYIIGALTAAYGDSSNQSGIIGTVASIFLFGGFYAFGLTPITQMYPPEVLSYNLRALGMGLFTLLNKACGIFVSMAFPYMFDAIGWKTYMVNASWNILFIVWAYFYWVETKGKTLEEIDELFDGVKHSDVPNLSDLDLAKKDAQISHEA